MIAAFDGGIGTFGWAVVRPFTGQVIAAGVIVSKPDPKLGVHVDRERRVNAQINLVIDLLDTRRITEIAVEEMSFAPRGSASAKIGIGMSWGALLGVARARGVPFRVVPPKRWQRAIVPAEPGEKPSAAVPYEKVLAALSRFVDARAVGLEAFPRAQRIHGYDAAGVGVFAAVADPTPRGAAA